MRQQLIVELKTKGIENKQVLSVMSKLPRHYFLDKAFADWAYRDVAFQIDADQTISQPYTVAFQSDLLDIKKTDIILEIGTGSGYQACVLQELAKKVYTIERQEDLYHKTSALLKILGYGNIRNSLGDGFLGLPRFAPFDKILVTCGASTMPTKLLPQLKDGGIMVIPMGVRNQRMIKIIKKGNELIKEEHGSFRFVPMLEGINRSKRFISL